MTGQGHAINPRADGAPMTTSHAPDALAKAAAGLAVAALAGWLAKQLAGVGLAVPVAAAAFLLHQALDAPLAQQLSAFGL